MYSLVKSPFSRDFVKTEIDLLKYQQCFNNVHSTYIVLGYLLLFLS